MSRRVKLVAVTTFVVLIVVFFGLYLRDIDYQTLSDLSFSWPLLILATTISLLFRYWGVFIWRTILSDLGSTRLPPFLVLSNVYAKAWMGRYIPGTVAWIGGKIVLASRLGISKSRLAVSSLLEAGMQVVASMCVALLILGLDPRLDVISVEVKVVMVVLAVASLAILLPPVLNAVLSVAFRVIRRRDAFLELRTNGKATVRSFLLYVAGTVLSGSAYFYLTKALYPPINAAEDFWFVVGAFTLAGALGMATPLVPSGLGVRDGVQLLLLAIIMPKEIALAVTVASRLWSAAVDVLFLVSAQGLHVVHRRWFASVPTTDQTSAGVDDPTGRPR